jgi:hypothetical protein
MSHFNLVEPRVCRIATDSEPAPVAVAHAEWNLCEGVVCLPAIATDADPR